MPEEFTLLTRHQHELYVLVEEITPTMDNFGVYIDNQHCDIDSQVSCPRTLIVRHETQEVLIKTVHTMPMRVQVYVGWGRVSTAGRTDVGSLSWWEAGLPPTEPGLERAGRCSADTFLCLALWRHSGTS